MDTVVFPYVQILPQDNSSVASRSGDYTRSHVYNPFSCVNYIKFKRPDQVAPWGSPNKVEVYDILFPFAGLIVVTKEGPVGHTAYVEEVKGGDMRVSECNYKAGVCGERWIKIGDPIIRGYK